MRILRTMGKILRLLGILWIGLALIRISAGALGWLDQGNVILGFAALTIATLAYKIGKVVENRSQPQQ